MFRFSIRDVLWLTVVVALSAAWGLDHGRAGKRLAEEQSKQTDWLWQQSVRLGGTRHMQRDHLQEIEAELPSAR